ncbi:MAG: DUF1552 domain-containing protein [Verrucomicrobiaceae bacterium]|nr:DUF1552 domain-containing protein [Verrucomicrobiaceae bacterium]
MLALPFLPSYLTAREPVPGPDKKLVIVYIPNGLVRRCFIPGEEEKKLPGFVTVKKSEKKRQLAEKTAEGIYPLELTSSMGPLSAHANNISLITGLDRPYKLGGDAHEQGASCYLSSVSPEEAESKKLKFLQGRTLDHIIGEKVGGSGPLKTLEVSCNGFRAPKESPRFDNISWYDIDKMAPSTKNPQDLYDRLFSSSKYQNHLDEVTSLVIDDAKSLSKTLGHHDRELLDEYMSMIRDIEVRMKRLQKLISDSRIKRPADEVIPRGEYIRLQADLMLTALQAGITNVSTFMIGPERWDAPMLYEGVFERPVVHHNMSHNQKGEGYKKLQKIDLFHMEQYAYILSRMESMKEEDGSSLLDNSVVACGVGLGDGATHQYFDLPLIMAGGAQGQLKHGVHIQCKNGTPISNAWLSIAQLMGVELNRFSDSTGTLNLRT